MKKKAIILTIITIIAIGIITLGVCWRNKNVKENSNLISCGNHIDEDQNMLCDNCGVDLSKSGILVKKSLTQNINEKQKVEIEGNMPAQSELTIKEVDENKSQEMAQKIYKDSKVIASYEIGINNKNQKYQPEKQGEKVIVKISGLELEEDKTYVILHMEDNNKKYEKINIKKIGKDTVEFKARSFSTYILVEINEYFVTFEGNGNFKVKTNAGVEVESGEQLLISDFSNFTVEPEDGYVVYGEIELIDKNGKITILDKKVSNLTTTYTIPTIEGSSRVKIRTTFAPKITEQPKITKAVPGEPVSFTVKSQYTQRYQWQYKEPGINIWKNIEGTKIGIVESDEKQSKLIITNVTKANTAFEYRCLLINNGCNTEETAVKTNPVMAIYTTTSELDVKYTGEVLEDITGKILISGDLEYGATLIVDTSEIKPTDCNLTYKWYSNSIASTENGTQIKTGTNTYQITKAEIGKYIYVEVVATKDGYNERTIKAITYDTVGKMIIQKPKVSGEYIYTGTEQTVQLENYNTATMTASNITRINSGKQVVTVSLKDSSIYSWEDQTTADVKLEWEIKKLDRTLTIEKSVELEQGKTTILTYKYDGENADVYVKNDNETVISVTNTSTTNGGTLTIVGKEIGKANITINVKETTNYGDVNASIECQVVKAQADTAAYMITEWTIPSANTTIKLPVQGTGLNITVDWGDGTAEQTVTTSFPTHTYATAGTYEIKVWGTCPKWGYASEWSISTSSNYYTYTQYLTKVKQFGELGAKQYGFSLCKNLTEVSGDNLVTSKTFENVTDMSDMFSDCSNLTSLDVSSFDTSKVTNMSMMFSYCSKLTSLDLSGFDTSKVTNMSSMFFYCSNLTSLDVSRFDTSKVTNMSSMFYNCGNLTSLDVSGFDTSEVISMSNMFNNCTNLTSLDVSKFNTSNVTKMLGMFNYCRNLTSLDVSGFDTSKVINMSEMFNYCSKLTSLDVSKFNTSKVTDMSRMFYNCSSLTSLDASNFNTSNVTIMEWMFSYCSNLTSLDLSGFDTSKVTIIEGMFRNCSNLTSLDLSGFDTSEVISMSNMFSYCSNLTSLDVSKFDTSKVTDMSYMFYNCSNLTSLDVSGFDTSKVTNMPGMFSYCSNLTSLDVSGFDTSKVTIIEGMFRNCSNLTSLDLSNFDTSKVTNMQNMFLNCSKLKSLQLSNKFAIPTSNNTYIFTNTPNLTSIILVDSTPLASQFTNIKSQLDGKTFYVPSKVAETAYETSWVADFTADRIHPILELVGDENVTIKAGETYTDAGYTVAGFDKTNSGDYTVYGYNVTTSGEVNTAIAGTYKIDYTITRTYTNAGVAQTDTLMSVERTVTVEVNEKAKMITEWTIPSANTTIKLPVQGTGLNITVEWGDGSSEQTVTTKFPTHTYATAGTYEIKVWGTCPMWGYASEWSISTSSNYYTYTKYLTKVKQFGELSATLYGFAQCNKLTEVSGDNLVTEKTFKNVTNMSYMFYYCNKLTALDVSGFNTLNVTNMSNMFCYCSNLTALDVSAFNTSNVTNMSNMFSDCTRLTSLNLMQFDTSKVTNMVFMFDGCSSLTSLDLSGFDTSKVTDMSYMFGACIRLTNLDVSKLDTSKVTNMKGMFSACRILTSLEISNFDTSSVENMSYMFYGCSNLITLDLSAFNTSNVTNMSNMFSDCTRLTSLNLMQFDTSKVTNMVFMFDGCSSLTSLDLSGFNTSQVKNMSNMFCDCSSLTSLNVSNFDTSNVTNMSTMFYNCSSLTSLNVTGFNTSKITNMYQMFYGCSNLTTLDLSTFDTSNVTTMYRMFYSCSSLTNLGVSNFNTSNVTNMYEMFCSCSDLVILDIGAFDTSNVTDMGYMFSNCSGLTSLDLSNFNTSSVTDMRYMFEKCGNLKSLQLSNKFKIPTSRNANMFTNTPSLKSIILIDTEPLASQFTPVKSQLTGKTFYVPSKSAETAYETSWVADFTADRIQPILELVGDENVTIKAGETYTDAGYTVAGFDKTNSGDYTVYGYNVTTSGEVNTAVAGKYTIEYILTRTYKVGILNKLAEVMRVTRTVTVEVNEKAKMITEWTIPAANTTIKLPVQGTGLKITVDWGDGTAEQTVTTAFPTHIYATAGTYEIKVWGTCPHWGDASSSTVSTTSNYYTYTQYLTKVKQFGELGARQYGFAQCKNLTEVSGNNLVTSKTFENVTDMADMFYNCSNLTSLDVSGFDTSKVTNMSAMFYSCSNLTSLDVSGFDTSNVTTMSSMFGSCRNLTSLNVSGFDTSNVTTMGGMFDRCRNLTSLNVSGFDTSNVTDMSGMFQSCSGLTSLDVSGFDTSNVTTMGGMFSTCRNLTSLNVSGFDTSKVTNMSGMFSDCSKLTSLDVSGFDTAKVTKMSSMFNRCSNLTSLDVSEFDTAKVTDMSLMFYYCSNLTSLDVSGFDTSNVRSMYSMFQNCSGLTSLDLSNFNTSKVTDMSYMFYNCTKLKSLQLSNKFKTPTSNISNMFTNTPTIKSIIIVDSEPLASQFTPVKSQLTGKTFYVPNKVAETAYEESWSGDFTADRIQPILELVGDENVTIKAGETYTDAGYTVAGFDKTNSGDYTVYGYNVTTSGEVNTAVAGKYTIEYILTRTHNNGTGTVTEEIMKATRTVEVIDTASYMITEWTIPSANTTIKLPVQGTGLNITVDWGDGSAEQTVTTAFPTHIYAEAGTYEIKVRGNCPEWGYASSSTVSTTSDYYTYTQYLTKVKQFGELNATRYGFARCTSLTEVSGENLVTSKTFEKVTSMEGMFYNCEGLINLDLSNFDTSKVTSMSRMFDGCSRLTNLDVSGFDTSQVTSMYQMFYVCSSLTNLDLSGFNTSKVTNMGDMFYHCSSLTNLDVSRFDTSSVTYMGLMFADCSSLTNLDVSRFDTSKVTNMGVMFYNCEGLTNLDVSGFNTSKVTEMGLMFAGCSSLTNLDVSGFDTSNVTSMQSMFRDCSKLTNLDVSRFNTSQVTDMISMFDGCSSLTNLDVSRFDTSNVTSMSGMFAGCSSLTSLDVSRFNTSKVTDMYVMFSGCSNLKTLQLSNKYAIPTSNATNMFTNTTNLNSIILVDNIPLANQFTNVKDQLNGKKIYVPNKVAETTYEESWSGDFTADRIQPILELVGKENITLNVGNTYTDAGYTVAGFDKTNSGDYTVYGYNVTTSGEVNTAVAGKYTIEYILTRTHNNGTGTVTEEIMKATRTVEVIDTASYMITEWNVSGDAGLTIKLPAQGIGLNITVDWGDGSDTETFTTAFPTHTYATAGTYEIKVWGTCPEWGYSSRTAVKTTSDYYTYTQYLTKVKQFGELNAIRYGFAQCENLVEVSGENLVTSKTFEKTTSMAYMFYQCSSITNLDVSNFDTSKATTMSYMFFGCSNLTKLDVSNFDTSKVTTMSYMFFGCSNLTKLDVSNFDTSKVTIMSYMFGGCRNLKSLDVSDFDVSNVSTMECMFAACSNLISLDVSNFNTSNVTNMGLMFSSCRNLTSLDLSNFDTSNVINMTKMFNGCANLKELNLNNFNTLNVTKMSSMFRDCGSLTSLNVSSFDTSKVTDMSEMFYNCSSLTSLDISKFDTSKVTDMSRMFRDCRNLTSLDVSNFDTSNVKSTSYMFDSCTNLKSLQLSNKFKIPTSKNTDIFANTTSLNSLILVDTEPLASQFTSVKSQITGKTIYVPNKVAETAYETAWASDFTADRIRPILELVGKENITLNVGNTYTDAGYTVAGFDKTNSGDYTVYGYNVTTSGEVNTAVAGKYTIEYILTRTHNNGTGTVTEEIMKATRTVEVIDTASYMITEWNVSGDAGLTIKLPVQGTGLNITVDWGDGTESEAITTAFPTHTYDTAGTYEIKVLGTCPEWGYASLGSVSTTSNSNYYTYTQYLTKVKQFGELGAQQYGFAQCKNLTEVSGDNLVTSKTFENVTDMSYMFYYCSNLTSLDVSGFDTSKVTNMSSMFRNCSNLTSLDVSKFNTSNVTSMLYMFCGCSNLTSLDLTNFDTSKVTDMSGMFYNCSKLMSLDVSGFDTSKVTDMSSMFYYCSNLTSLDVSKFNTSNVTDMSRMFYYCSNLTSLDVSGFDTSKVTTMAWMFYNCSNLTSLDVSGFDTAKVTNMRYMFGKCSNLTSLDVSGFDTSKVTDMSVMFYNCTGLISLDLTNFDTLNVTTMSDMFSNCSNLTSLDVSGFDTSKVTNMQKMFLNCSKLKSLQLTNKFKIPSSGITDMFTNTTNLTSIILVDSTPLAGQFTNIKSQLDGKKFYVPNKVAETAYEESWSGDFTADRIQPILELVGKENITLNVGETYTDAGYTVAGFTKADSGAYTCYGYSVSSSGEVNTAVAGKYKITYKVTRTYEKDGQTITTQPYEVTREITVMALPLTKPTLIGTYTYNGLIQTAQLKTVNESRFEITNNTRKDAGTQEITVSIKDKNTYAWEDGTTDDIKITWEIKPIIAEITWSATTIEYDGTAKTVTATVSNAVNGEVITVTEYEGTTTAVNVGEYTAKVKSLSSTNYTLEGALNTEKKWYIQVTVVDMQVIMKDYSYGGTLPTPSITNNSAGRKVTYYYSENDTNQGGTDWSTVKDSFALPVGTYYMYAIVEANQNYQETLTDPVSFKVLGTELKVSVTKENKIEYDGNWVNQNVYIYITVEGNANVTAYQYKIGTNGSWIDKVTSPVILQNNMNGEVIVRGVNPAGKAVTSEKSAGLIKIDKTVPSITNVSYKNENKELSITATINDNLSGITAYAITAENGIREWIESTQGTKQAIVDGSGTYTIWAKDEAGNIGHETIDVVKDIHAPVGTIIVKDAYTVESNIYYTNQMNVILQITATDDISTSNQIKMAIYKEDDYNALTSEDEIVWEQYKENKQWTLTKENADEKIYLILKDMAGNISVKVGK